VGEFESRLLGELKAAKPEIINSIRTDREIKKDVEAQLVAFLDSFAKSFA
jgi:F-type H+-transporting ATPase subunit alpha